MPFNPDTLTIVVPGDLASSIAAVIESKANHYRRDTGHDPDDVAVLRRDADRMDELAARIRGDAEAIRR